MSEPAKAMTEQTRKITRPNYGIDAPDIVRRLAIFGVVGILAAILLETFRESLGGWARLSSSLLPMGITFLLTAMVMLRGSLVGKKRLRDRVIDSLDLRSDEQVLDVGCGHGLMLTGAAKRLTTGKATGVDIWQQEDQAGNSAAATMENARLEGVASRVELKDGDARNLPFADGSFDVIISSWALHNIYDREERDRAIHEIVRVLKPGGRAAIIDIRHTSEYAEVFKASGMQAVKRGSPNFLFLIPSYCLTATKPPR